MSLDRLFFFRGLILSGNVCAAGRVVDEILGGLRPDATLTVLDDESELKELCLRF